ncbi:hypothetical protein [Acinetobacter wuhouensis]|uniref:Uncharacterized protein n=1 Tax=Acinetobacter wuhouensis TaxID=1879050 RepID=A0A3G2T2F2_9GAMM|nr:hypothetical protein [Acinetobacter wuhouensis]AYO54430.1 hypothetical protein CDG68_12625 [Acinetobacter wuhouensis]
MRPIVKQKNFLGFKIWLENLGYEVKQLDGGLVARAKSREAQRAYKKSHHYVRVGSDLSGNQAAYELGAEFENHLRAPEQTCTAKAEQEILHIVKGDSHGMGYLVA